VGVAELINDWPSNIAELIKVTTAKVSFTTTTQTHSTQNTLPKLPPCLLIQLQNLSIQLAPAEQTTMMPATVYGQGAITTIQIPTSVRRHWPRNMTWTEMLYKTPQKSYLARMSCWRLAQEHPETTTAQLMPLIDFYQPRYAMSLMSQRKNLAKGVRDRAERLNILGRALLIWRMCNAAMHKALT
jgi:hypothetical protein